MSAIEKICEYSGDYDGHKMYEYKLNRIQVNPEYRKLFNGKDFKLFRFLSDRDMWDLEDYCLYVPELLGEVDGFYYNWHYNKWKIVKRKLKKLMKCREIEEIRIPMTLRELQTYCDYGDVKLFLLNSDKLTNDNWEDILNDSKIRI